jgi:hypothetical protein
LDRTIAAYERLTPCRIEWIIERDHVTCGSAWADGIARSSGRWVHVAADDLEPASEGWLAAAAAALEFDRVPLGRVHEGAETFGRDFCRVPMFQRQWWRDTRAQGLLHGLSALHYFSDNLVTDAMIAAGHEPVVVDGYDFIHRRSQVGRGAGMSEAGRMEHDRSAYLHLRSRSRHPSP